MIVAHINQVITTDAQRLIRRTITETTSKLMESRSLPKNEVNYESQSLKDSIQYLSAKADFIANEKKSYCIRLFGWFMIDMDLVRSFTLSLLAGIVAAVFSFIKSKSLLA